MPSVNFRFRRHGYKSFLNISLPGFLALSILLTVTAGCGRSGGPGSEVASAPPSSGEIWVIDPTPDRGSVPGSVLAYLHGLHTIVVDGKDVFAGMTPLKAEVRPGGGHTIKLDGGLEATLVPGAAGLMQLRFSTGEVIAMNKRTAK